MSGKPTGIGSWVLACAAAEAIGMTAAAGSARVGQDLVDRGEPRMLALALVIAGGLVEGLALGLLQGGALRARWPRLRAGTFLAATLAVAGLGWAVASAPSVLGSNDGAAGPPLPLILAGGFGIGVAMGPLLGAAQVLGLRGAVAHPWRWVWANTAAWPFAMAVIFAGASTAGASWPLAAVIGYGTLTGAAAGAVLGLISGRWLEGRRGPDAPAGGIPASPGRVGSVG